MLSIDAKVLGPAELTVLAEGTYRLLRDTEQAKRLIEGVDQHKLQTGVLSSDSGLEPFDQRFRINRLMYALGERRQPSEIVLDTGQSRDKSMVLFERNICTLAQIWAKAWVGQPMEGATIKQETSPLLRLFSSSNLERDGGLNRFAISPRSGAFFSLLIDAVAQHGSSALEGLWNGFKQEWDDPRIASRWSTEKRRNVIRAFARAGFERTWTSERLHELDEFVPNGGDPSERAEECINHAEAWLEVEEHEQARHFLRRALEVGVGVGSRKDYQLDTWIGWLDRIIAIEPEMASKRNIQICASDSVLGRQH